MRKQVTKITVEFNDGPPRIYEEGGYMPVALFWGDGSNSGIRILGLYYDALIAAGNPRSMTYADLERNFCKPIADAVCPPGGSVVLDHNVIDTIWNTPCNPLIGIMSKDPGCDAGG
jgi:hypothetical protein